MLNIIQPDNDFKNKLNDLFEKYDNVDPDALGMKPDWQHEPVWK